MMLCGITSWYTNVHVLKSITLNKEKVLRFSILLPFLCWTMLPTFVLKKLQTFLLRSPPPPKVYNSETCFLHQLAQLGKLHLVLI